MNANEANQKFLLVCARNRITNPEEVQATMQAILASAPQAVLDSMADKSDVEMALELADAYFRAHGEGATDDPNVTKDTKPQDAPASAEELSAIQDYLDANASDTAKRAAQTHVVSVITDKPVLAKIHVPNARLVPTLSDKTEGLFAKWESTLVDTPENKQAFEDLKAAYLKKEEMEVYINPDAREKTIGWKISTTDDKEQPITMNLTRETAISFLLVKVQGAIQPRGEESIGIRIKWTAKRQAASGDNENNSASKGTTSVTLLNRKALQSNDKLSICSCQIQEVNGEKLVNDQFNAKTAASFKVVTDRKNKKGEVICRTIRLPGKTSAYRVQRLEEFVNDFGPAERAKGVGMTKTEKKKVTEAVKRALIGMQGQAVEDNDLRTALAAIRANQRAAGPKNFS